jgi:hypothetical protein
MKGVSPLPSFFLSSLSYRFSSPRVSGGSSIGMRYSSLARGTFTIEHAANRRFTTTTDDPILGESMDGKGHTNLAIENARL